uniref:von Willebrand factor A domain containing 7 n=1 Tax=Leptobrachium leishanense TaxID=445787 RepID=A0A8C5WJ49_9ANUR
MASNIPTALCLLLLVVIPGGQAFFPNFWTKFLGLTWRSYTHQDLTEDAILNVTLQILLERPHPTRPPLRVEDFQGKTLIADDILRAYFGEEASTRQFRASMQQIVNANSNMDFLSGTRDDPLCHFDSERLQAGNSRLQRARDDLLGGVRAKNYEWSRERLGQILHSLQDFYSHTNWVELGNEAAHPDLATPGMEIDSLASASDQTCTDCTDGSCKNNIADFIKMNNLLTSGYYGDTHSKPDGKCSHGGPFDDSRHLRARGGINKDTASPIFSPHHFLHQKAAILALEASIKFLNELRTDLTDQEMLRLLGVSSFPALSFVVDTTGSMGEEIRAVQLQARNIINRQNVLPPDNFILVPFHDPGYGPEYKTNDSREFLNKLDSLLALGGGDEPEMCLSALRLALINTPPYSEIFVFTDASAKDIELRNSVEALIQAKRMKVSFLITEDPSWNRGRSRRAVLRQDRFDLYSDLASTSGGKIIFSNNEDIYAVTDVIAESSHFDMVNLLDVKSEKRGETTHMFEVDGFLHDVSLFVNGGVQRINIYDPDGLIQNVKKHRKGLFTQMSLEDPLSVGKWSITVTTTRPYSLHVQGRTSFDFLYYFGAFLNGSHPGLHQYTGQPVAGVPSVLVIEPIGLPESAHLDQVSLTTPHGDTRTLDLKQANQSRFLMAEVGSVPIGEFRVGVSGQDNRGHELHRQAPQHVKSSECVVELSLDFEKGLIAGQRLLVPLTVTKYGSCDCYTVTLSTDSEDFKIRSDVSKIIFRDGRMNTSEFWIEARPTASPTKMVMVSATVTSCEDITKFCFTRGQLPVKAPLEKTSYSYPNCSSVKYSGSCPSSWHSTTCRQHQWRATMQSYHPEGIKSVQTLNNTGRVSHRLDGKNETITFDSDCCSLEEELLLTTYGKTTGYCHVRVPSASVQLCLEKILAILIGAMYVFWAT